MVRKEKIPSMKDLDKQLDVIDNFNKGSFGSGASFKNASTFQAKKLNEATDKKFGSRLTKRLKNSRELL